MGENFSSLFFPSAGNAVKDKYFQLFLEGLCLKLLSLISRFHPRSPSTWAGAQMKN